MHTRICARVRALIGLLAIFAVTVAGAGTLTGIATYRERIALPPDAVFEATLHDVARPDAPAAPLGRARLDPAGQPPFRFAISYDDAIVGPHGHYAVRATITHRGRLLFATGRLHPVLDGRDAPLELLLISTRRASAASARNQALGALPAAFEGELPGASGPIVWHVDLFPEGRFHLRITHVGRPAPNQFDDIGRWLRQGDSGRIVLRGTREAPVFLLPVDGGAALRKLDLLGQPIESTHEDRLRRRTPFTPIEPRLHLTGMFGYLADAASIVLCADDRTLPVAMEADFKALEAAYLRVRVRPGERLLVSVDGLLAPRPSMESSQPARTSLVVERFIGVWPDQRCPARRPLGSRLRK
jgi:uncharacterized lipoprotein YbaY/uncharacterized lipoprotein NlpE involved in copper resistance